MPLLSLYRGLLHIFEGYKAPIAELREDPTRVTAHFAKVPAQLGVDLPPPERLVRALGRSLLADTPALARRFFELDLALRPDSPGAHVAMGDAAVALDEAALAMTHYRRALALDPDSARAAAQLRVLEGR